MADARRDTQPFLRLCLISIQYLAIWRGLGLNILTPKLKPVAWF